MACPNINTNEWKALVDKVGELGAYKAFISNGDTIPSLEEIEKLKPFIMFQTNPASTMLKKALKLSSKQVSGLQKAMILKRLKEFNNRYGSTHSIAFTQKGQSDIYTWEITEKWGYNSEAIQMFLFQGEGNISPEGRNAPISDLNAYLEQFLAKYGITVQRMDKILGQDKSIIALADLANKMVKIVNGKENKETLPEETGHFIIEMLGKDNPLFQRIMSLAKQSQKYKDIYEEYFELYKDDFEVVKEAAGKLLSEALIRNFEGYKENKTLLEKIRSTVALIWNTIKAKLLKIPSAELQNLLDEVSAGVFLRDDNLLSQLSTENISEDSKKLEKAQLEIDPIKKTVENAKASLKQKLAIYSKNPKFTKEWQGRVEMVLDALSSQDALEGLTTFVQGAISDLKDVVLRLEKNDKKESDGDILSISRLNYLYQYASAYDVLDDFQNIWGGDEEVRKLQEIVATQVIPVKNQIKNKYRIEGAKLIAKKLHKFAPAFLTEEKIQEALIQRVGDINSLKMMVSSVGDLSDPIIGLATKVLRYSKYDVHRKLIDYKKKIVDLIEEYKTKSGKIGTKATDFLYQRNTKGGYTGRYIEELGSAFWEQRDKFRSELEEVENSVTLTATMKKEKRKLLINKWIDFTGITRSYTILSIYNKDDDALIAQWSAQNNKKEHFKDKVFANMTPDQKDFYIKFVELKKELDLMTPHGENYRNLLPQIQSGFWQKVWASGDHKVKLNAMVNHFNFVEQKEKRGATESKALFKEDGSEAKFVPLHYIGLLPNPDTIEKDLGSSMIMYAEMAINNEFMRDIEAEMVLTRSLLAEQDVTVTKFGKPVISAVTGREQLKKGRDTNIYRMFDEWLDANLYGETEKEELLGNVNMGKLANFLNTFTAYKGLALNLMSPISNVTFGRLQRMAEAVSGQHFNMTDWGWANKTYFKELGLNIGDVASVNPQSKFGLFVEGLNLTQSFEEVLKNGGKKLEMPWYRKMLLGSNMFFLITAGEHMLQISSALAIGKRFKLKNGDVVNLYDMCQVVDGKIKWDEKVTNEDLNRFKDVVTGVNQTMDGIYTQVDRAIAQRYAIGRMGFLFRKFIVPSFEKRWKKHGYNFKRDTEEEGIYISFGKFIGGLFKEFRASGISGATLKSFADKTEDFRIYGAKKAAYELFVFASLGLLTTLLKDGWDDDDEPVLNYTFYQMVRLYTELGAFIPPVGLVDFFKIVKSPAAGVNTTQDIVQWVGALIPPYDTYEGGRHEGDSKLYWKTIKMVPMLNQVDRIQNVKEQTKNLQILF